MTKTSIRVLALGVALSLVSVVLGSSSEQDATLKQIARYREWTRVNEKPISVVDYSSGGG